MVAAGKSVREERKNTSHQKLVHGVIRTEGKFRITQ